MSFALLFSGQGTLHGDMWSWLSHHSEPVLRTERALGVTDWRGAMARDPTWAAANRQAQLLLTGLGLAAWSTLSSELPPPAAVAGYSVGELAAFSAAGVFDADTAVRLAALRADAMDRCVASAPGGLLAVTGLAAAALDRVCAELDLSVAIRIDSDSAVLGGSRQHLAQGEHAASVLGARCTPLNVTVPSHTPVLQAAAEDFGRVLAGAALRAPAMLLIDNLAAERVSDAPGARRSLAQQIAHTVQWADCLAAIHARRVDCVLEIGPGSALAAMWNRRFPDVPARSADEFRSAAAVIQWVSSHTLR